MLLDNSRFRVQETCLPLYSGAMARSYFMPVLGAVCPYSKMTESLTVGHRITYKLCLTTWKTLNTSLPL